MSNKKSNIEAQFKNFEKALLIDFNFEFELSMCTIRNKTFLFILINFISNF